MSGTKFHLRKAPVTDAVIVSHGQPSDPGPAEDWLAERGELVGQRLPYWTIRTATLASPGKLERVLNDLATEALVYPFFMSDGWFTKKALPKRLAGYDCRILQPFGLDPDLPAFAAGELHEAARRKGWRMDDCDVLIAAHGSATGPVPAQRACEFADRLQAILRCKSVRAGFLEEPPYLPSVAADSGPNSLCVPFFAAEGNHVTEDLVEMLSAGQFPGLCLPPIGQLTQTADLIARSLDWASTEKETVA